MRIGLIDCDRKNSRNPFPNLALMKLSAWHKAQGDTVNWYSPFDAFIEPYDKVYVSKVFSFSWDYNEPIIATEVVRGGSGYAISMQDGREVYDKSKDSSLPSDVEHIYPDYSIYGITDTAYGFLTRGCPRGCSFCHVKDMQGTTAHRVAQLSEFWRGQKNIVLLDPNISACCEWKEVFQELIDSKATVDFSQGLDIRVMTEGKAEMLNLIKTKTLHFAWDRYEDKGMIVPKFKEFRKICTTRQKDLIVYCIVGDRERRVLPEDLERINTLREIGYAPYVTVYDVDSLPKGHELKKLQRWVNNRFIFWKIPTFEEYLKGKQ